MHDDLVWPVQQLLPKLGCCPSTGHVLKKSWQHFAAWAVSWRRHGSTLQHGQSSAAHQSQDHADSTAAGVVSGDAAHLRAVRGDDWGGSAEQGLEGRHSCWWLGLGRCIHCRWRRCGVGHRCGAASTEGSHDGGLSLWRWRHAAVDLQQAGKQE